MTRSAESGGPSSKGVGGAGQPLGQESDSSRPPHVSVLAAEVLTAFSSLPSGATICDLTLGRGGHAELLLEQGFRVIGFDQDEAAIVACRTRLARFGDSFVAVHRSFRHVAEVLREMKIEGVDGLLVDLGVSSPQLDEAGRGFSFQKEGPLDMRMDQRGETTAADLVNELPEDELVRIFWELGEEKGSRRAARAIVERRRESPFVTTSDLAELMAVTLPKRGRIHPATKVFQGLRLAVNDELGALEDLLGSLRECLLPGGRFVSIAFHSLEDRRVKRTLRAASTRWLDRPEWPEPQLNPDFYLSLPVRRAVQPSAEEISRNPRSRSARLRIAERIRHEES